MMGAHLVIKCAFACMQPLRYGPAGRAADIDSGFQNPLFNFLECLGIWDTMVCDGFPYCPGCFRKQIGVGIPSKLLSQSEVAGALTISSQMAAPP